MKVRSLVIGAICLGALTAEAQEKLSVEEVVTRTLEKGYDIQLSRNQLASSATDAKNAIGLFIPDVTVNGGRTFSQNDSRQTLADNTEVLRPDVRSNNLNGNAQLNWVLFDGLKMFATFKGLQKVQDLNEVQLKVQMANTMADVIANYHNVVAQKQQLKAINEQISVGEERVKLAERKLQVGTGVKTELLQAKLDQNAFKTLALQQQAVIAETKAMLNSTSGMQLPDEYDVADTIILNLDLTFEEIMEGMEQTNPQLIAARENIEVARLAVSARRGDRFPIISAIANYNFGRTKNSVATSPFAPVFNQNSGLTYGAQATWFLVNNLTITNAIQLAVINLQRQGIIYEQQKALALAGVRASFARYDNSRKILNIEEENIGFARENVFIMLESFKRGVTTFIELRTAQQSMVDAYNRLTTARYNAKVSETELLRLKGALLR